MWGLSSPARIEPMSLLLETDSCTGLPWKWHDWALSSHRFYLCMLIRFSNTSSIPQNFTSPNLNLVLVNNRFQCCCFHIYFSPNCSKDKQVQHIKTKLSSYAPFWLQTHPSTAYNSQRLHKLLAFLRSHSVKTHVSRHILFLLIPQFRAQ